MKLIIGTLITAIALMTLPMNGNSGNREEKQFKQINQKKCEQGDQKACEALQIMKDIANCSNPKIRHLEVNTQNGEVLIRNMGYPKIILRTKNGKITELIPCDSATLRVTRGHE